jgi:hypothetical protein
VELPAPVKGLIRGNSRKGTDLREIDDPEPCIVHAPSETWQRPWVVDIINRYLRSIKERQDLIDICVEQEVHRRL